MHQRILLFILFYIFCTSLKAQLKPEQALNILEDRYPVEKIFLQYNKPSYVVGENIWFKGYVATGNAPSTTSTNLYVELYDDKKQLLDKVFLPIKGGATSGSFSISDKWDEGEYYIRAYTLWSMNFTALPYLHPIRIYNPASLKKLAPKSVQWSIKVYPESGTLLAETQNKIAVRLASTGTLPGSWKGTITEVTQPEKIITAFDSHNPEIGFFTFTPESNKQYQLQVTDNLGTGRTIALPKAASTGALLQVNNMEDNVQCDIVVSPSLSNKGYTLIGQMHNQLVYQAKFVASSKGYTATIPLKKLTEGVLHFTLFNDKLQAVAERLCFINNKEPLLPRIQFDTLSMGKRSANHWSIAVDTTLFQSYTTIVMDSQSEPFSETIESSLLLTNDITSSLQYPAWYFDENNRNRSEALDAILLTEKWKWFQWSKILAGQFPLLQFKPDNYLSYTGAVFLGRKLQLNKTINLVYELRDSTILFQKVQTDSSGAFTTEGGIFIDSFNLFYQLNSKRAGANAIKVYFENNNKFQRWSGALPNSKYYTVPRPGNDALPLFVQKAQSSLSNQLAVDKRYKELEQVIVRSKRKKDSEVLNKKLSSSAFQSPDEVVIDLINTKQNLSGISNVADLIRNQVPGLTASLLYRGAPVDIYIDEIKTNLASAQTLPITEVAMIKFLRTGSAMSSNPAILIYTRRGGLENPPFYGMPNTRLAGYKIEAPFPFINYYNDLHKSIENDTRQVLYWNTSLTPDSNGFAAIRFFNSDEAKTYKLITIGYKSDGGVMYFEKSISK